MWTDKNPNMSYFKSSLVLASALALLVASALALLVGMITKFFTYSAHVTNNLTKY